MRTVSPDVLRKVIGELAAPVAIDLIAGLLQRVSDSALITFYEHLDAPTHEDDQLVDNNYIAPLLPKLGRAQLYAVARRIPGLRDVGERRLLWSRNVVDRWLANGGGDLLPARPRRSPRRPRRPRR